MDTDPDREASLNASGPEVESGDSTALHVEGLMQPHSPSSVAGTIVSTSFSLRTNGL